MTVRQMGGLSFADLVASGLDAVPFGITPTGSPFTYTNTSVYTQRLFISGGTVLTISVKSAVNGQTILLGLLGGQVTLSPGDAMILTYVTAPAITAFNTTKF